MWRKLYFTLLTYCHTSRIIFYSLFRLNQLTSSTKYMLIIFSNSLENKILNEKNLFFVFDQFFYVVLSCFWLCFQYLQTLCTHMHVCIVYIWEMHSTGRKFSSEQARFHIYFPRFMKFLCGCLSTTCCSTNFLIRKFPLHLNKTSRFSSYSNRKHERLRVLRKYAPRCE